MPHPVRATIAAIGMHMSLQHCRRQPVHQVGDSGPWVQEVSMPQVASALLDNTLDVKRFDQDVLVWSPCKMRPSLAAMMRACGGRSARLEPS